MAKNSSGKQAAEISKIKTSNEAYYKALSARDMRAMEKVWTCAADNILIAPPSNPPLVTRLRWRKMHRQPTAIRLPPLARRGTPLRTDHPEPALSLEPRDRLTGTRTGTLSYRSRATTRITLTGGSKASIIGLPLASNAGGIGVREPALIG